MVVVVYANAMYHFDSKKITCTVCGVNSFVVLFMIMNIIPTICVILPNVRGLYVMNIIFALVIITIF